MILEAIMILSIRGGIFPTSHLFQMEPKWRLRHLSKCHLCHNYQISILQVHHSITSLDPEEACRWSDERKIRTNLGPLSFNIHLFSLLLYHFKPLFSEIQHIIQVTIRAKTFNLNCISPRWLNALKVTGMVESDSLVHGFFFRSCSTRACWRIEPIPGGIRTAWGTCKRRQKWREGQEQQTRQLYNVCSISTSGMFWFHFPRPIFFFFFLQFFIPTSCDFVPFSFFLLFHVSYHFTILL